MLQQSEVRQWPELTGKLYEVAAKAIKDQYPDLNVLKVPQDSPVTMDYRLERVRIFVDPNDIVVQTPRTG